MSDDQRPRITGNIVHDPAAAAAAATAHRCSMILQRHRMLTLEWQPLSYLVAYADAMEELIAERAAPNLRLVPEVVA